MALFAGLPEALRIAEDVMILSFLCLFVAQKFSTSGNKPPVLSAVSISDELPERDRTMVRAEDVKRPAVF